MPRFLQEKGRKELVAAGLAAYTRKAAGEVTAPEEVAKLLFDVQWIAFAALAPFHPSARKESSCSRTTRCKAVDCGFLGR